MPARSQKMEAAPPAAPRHPNHSLPLLPSGPGGICELSSRGDRRSHHRLLMLQLRRQQHDARNYRKTGGEGGIRTREAGINRLHTFQACSFNHSDTSPHDIPGGIVRPIHGPHPRFARASLRLSKFVPDEFVEPAKRGLTAYTLSRRAPSTTRTPLLNLRSHFSSGPRGSRRILGGSIAYKQKRPRQHGPSLFVDRSSMGPQQGHAAHQALRFFARMTRCFSRFQSRSFSVSRLSCSCLPRATPRSTLTRFCFQYSASGTSV